MVTPTCAISRFSKNEEGIIERQICGSDLDKADVPKLICSVLINEIQSQNFQMVPGQNSNGNEKCFKIEVFKALDFEEQTTYLLEIVLSDGLFNASTYVPLIVEDRPDQPPQWSRFPSIISFPEDTQVGHVIAVFVARDGDLGINQPIRYELREASETGNENIELNPETGDLTLVKQIDRDVNGAESYVLEFEIFAIEDDDSSEGITGDVLMTVTDVNDNIPTFSSPGPYAVLVPEGTVGNIIFDQFIEVADRDFGINGSYSAEILLEDPEVATGKLQILNPFTGTAKGSQVKVTEDADTTHVSEADFTIMLEDINDNYPVFVNKPPDGYKVAMSEAAEVGTEFDIDFIVEDADVSPEFGKESLRFELIFAGVLEGKININQITGKMALIQTVDREQILVVVNVIVSLYDMEGKNGSLSTEATVAITITDVNDEQPVLTLPSTVESLLEGFGELPPGDNSIVVQEIFATDPDEEPDLNMFIDWLDTKFYKNGIVLSDVDFSPQ
ncbi:hypothetical protein QYM36_000039, partial [Artemia franciscana]